MLLSEQPWIPPSPVDHVKRLLAFLDQYQSLVNTSVATFMTCDYWEQLDVSWQSALIAVDKDDADWQSLLIRLATADMSRDTWPTSLQRFVQSTRDLALPRQPQNDQPQTIHHCIQLGMNPKKKHEVERLTDLIAHVASRKDIHRIIDIGSGQGYLARSLAYHHQLHVVAVDGSEVQTTGAKRLDAVVQKTGRRASTPVDYVTEEMTDTNAHALLARHTKDPTQPWLLCGLHACGDLSSHMARLFVSQPSLHAIVNVGCCYHFLSEPELEEAMDLEHHGFPVSRALASLRLGSVALRLSCQAPSRWHDRPNETAVSFEHHFYRALLHRIMVDKGLAEPSTAPPIGRLNKSCFTSFTVYVRAALERLGQDPAIVSAKEAEEYYEQYKSRHVHRQIAASWTLRSLLAPLVESIILLDRWLYLNESLESVQSHTKGVWLLPLFDPIVSPRNMVLVAIK